MIPQTSKLRSMEEVWNDINVPTGHHHHHHQRRGFSLPITCPVSPFVQPVTRQPNNNPAISDGHLVAGHRGGGDRHVTFLSPSFSDGDTGSKKRAAAAALSREDSDGGGGDLRNKRMMKNRESAARSRARKQAYTNELEMEVAHLVEENAKLKKMYQELRLAMAAQLRNKNAIQRTSTAPF